VTPRGGRDAVDGWMRDGEGRTVLKVRVSAPPADGEANAAVIALIAKAVGRPKSSVRLAAGASSRVKTLEISDFGEAELAAAFGPPPA
jgi:uncharacterized protein YggU (UPF0235/DUF167 family)